MFHFPRNLQQEAEPGVDRACLGPGDLGSGPGVNMSKSLRKSTKFGASKVLPNGQIIGGLTHGPFSTLRFFFNHFFPQQQNLLWGL